MESIFKPWFLFKNGARTICISPGHSTKIATEEPAFVSNQFIIAALEKYAAKILPISCITTIKINYLSPAKSVTRFEATVEKKKQSIHDNSI
jgi:hypothetical protein